MKVKQKHYFSSVLTGVKNKMVPLAAILMMLFCSFPLFTFASNNWRPDMMESQQTSKTITGRITDQKGESLIGVNVVEAGTTNGTITDIDGNYTLKLTTTNLILNISYIGFTTQAVSVGTRAVINVTLEEETSYLDEVVVVGYGTMRQRDLTGAISTIKAEALKAESPRSVQETS